MNWIGELLQNVKVRRIEKAQFFCIRKDAYVKLFVLHHADGTTTASVRTDRTLENELLFLGNGTKARAFYDDMERKQEERYQLVLAEVRKMCGGKLPHED